MQMVFYTFLWRVVNVIVTCMLSSVMLLNIPQWYKSRIVMWKCFVSKCAHICGIVAHLFLKVFTTTIDTFRSNFLKLATKSYWKSWATWVLLWLKLLRGLKSLIINTIHSNCTLRPNTLLSLSGMTLVTIRNAFMWYQNSFSVLCGRKHKRNWYSVRIGRLLGISFQSLKNDYIISTEWNKNW